jgi:hypothetical protein
VNRVKAVGVSTVIRGVSDTLPKIYTPFGEKNAQVSGENGTFTVTVPEKTAYIVLHFEG